MATDFPDRESLPTIEPGAFWRSKPGFYRTAPGSHPDDPDSDSIVWLVFWPGFHPLQVTIPHRGRPDEPDEPNEPGDGSYGFWAAFGLKMLASHEAANGVYHRELVFAFIEGERAKGERYASLDGAEERLRNEVHKRALELRDRLVPLASHVRHLNSEESRAKLREEQPDFFGEPTTLAGHWERNEDADEIYASFLETLGKDEKSESRKLARIVRERSSKRHDKTPLERWQPWFPSNGEAAKRHTSLVECVWLDVVRPQLERAVSFHPSVAKPVHSNVSRVMSSVSKPVRTENGAELVQGNVRVSEFRTPERIAASAVEEYVKRIRSGVSRLGSIVSHRLIRHLVSTAHTRYADGDHDPRTIIFTGGFAAVADAIGCRSKADAEVVRDVLAAFDACRIFPDGTVKGGSFRLLMLDETPAKRGQQGIVKVTLADALLPHFGNRNLAPGEAQHLVPLLPVPPLVGRGQDHGAIATMGLETTALLRNRADELASEGHVGIDERDWRDLAERSSLPRARLSRVLERWLRDDSDGPAFLSSPAEGRFRLAPDYEAAHLFLVEGGNRTLAGRAAGQRSVQKRRGELKRHGGR